MHGRIVAAAAAAFVTVASSASYASPGGQGTASAPAAQTGTADAAQGTAGTDQVAGRVAFVDVQSRELAIDTGSATTQLAVAEHAQITVNGERASFEQLRQGVEVRATLDRSGDVPTATRIEATSKQK